MLTLASASPARRRLLEQAGLVHRVRVSGVDETSVVDADPQRLVQRLAQAKATVVAQALAAEGVSVAAGVLGCDSVLVVGTEVCGKPRDALEAAARWRRMAGGWGDLLTGHCLVTGTAEGGDVQARQAVVTTRVFFAPLTEAEILAYVATGEPLACAGGFALEGRGGLLVDRIEGCFSNVIGLSLPLLRCWLSVGSLVQG